MEHLFRFFKTRVFEKRQGRTMTTVASKTGERRTEPEAKAVARRDFSFLSLSACFWPGRLYALPGTLLSFTPRGPQGRGSLSSVRSPELRSPVLLSGEDKADVRTSCKTTGLISRYECNQ